MNEYLQRRRGYLEQYAQQQQLPTLQECQNLLQTENSTRRTFWWNQPITAPIQLLNTTIEEID
jgi:hypothetical protein